MSITSTLTVLGSAGSAGGLTYWVNEINCTQAIIENVMDVSPDLVCVGARTTGSSTANGAILVFNQDGALKEKKYTTVDGNSLLHPIYLKYDASTDAWYTNYFDASRQLVGRFSGDPTSSFTWLKDLGHGGTDTEHTYMQSVGNDMIFSTRVNGRGGICKVAKSNGNFVSYKSYAPQNTTLTSATIAKGNDYTSQVLITGVRQVSGFGASTVFGNLTTSLGSVTSGAYLYYSNPYVSSAGRSVIALDGSGNAFGQWGTYFWSTDSSGNLRFKLSQQYGSFIAFAWAETGGYLLAITQACDLIRINPATGQPMDGVRRGISGGDMKPISYEDQCNLEIDEENNIVWFTRQGVNEEMFIVKRPLDSSLDGTYGSYTLATNSMPNFGQITYGTFAKVNQSWYNYTESHTQVSKSASFSTDTRYSNSFQKIG